MHGEEVRKHAAVDLAFAVGSDDELHAPVGRGADRASVAQAAADVASLAAKERAGGLSTADTAESCFLVSNLGMLPIEGFGDAACLQAFADEARECAYRGHHRAPRRGGQRSADTVARASRGHLLMRRAAGSRSAMRGGPTRPLTGCDAPGHLPPAGNKLAPAAPPHALARTHRPLRGVCQASDRGFLNTPAVSLRCKKV